MISKNIVQGMRELSLTHIFNKFDELLIFLHNFELANLIISVD